MKRASVALADSTLCYGVSAATVRFSAMWPMDDSNRATRLEMTRSASRLLVIAALALPAPPAAALPVERFVLLDHRGARHDLDDYRDAKAVVLMVQGNGCPLVRNAVHDLRAVRDRFQSEKVAFLMLNANPQDDAQSIRAEVEDWGFDLPVLVDETQAVGKSLELKRTAEVLVLTPAWRVAYRGPVNDRLTYEHQRAAANKHYLADALQAVLAGERPAVARVDAPGCLINFSPGEVEQQAPQGARHRHHKAP